MSRETQVFYPGQNDLELWGLANQRTGAKITDAQVTAAIYNWPGAGLKVGQSDLTLVAVGDEPGHYRGQWWVVEANPLPSQVALLRGNRYRVHVTADAGADGVDDWDVLARFIYRS